jgi:hypothetical protein
MSKPFQAGDNDTIIVDKTCLQNNETNCKTITNISQNGNHAAVQ